MGEIVRSQRIKGILLAVIASALWSIGGLLVKFLDWNPVAIAGSRSVIASLVILAYIRKPKITKSKPQIIGAIAYSATVLFYVIANKLTTAANAILLQYTAPIFVAILSFWILKERIRWYDIVSIGMVILGMCLFFIEEASIDNVLGNIVAIASGFAMACNTLALRAQKDSSGMESVLLGNLLTFIIALPFVLKISISLRDVLVVAILGIFQLGISYIFYVDSLKYITALEAILIAVLEPLLNPLWVYIFLKEKPGINAIIGGIIVVVAITLRGILSSKTAPKKDVSSENAQKTNI
jgi:drug/metabolite transporter (DMT)-like permease